MMVSVYRRVPKAANARCLIIVTRTFTKSTPDIKLTANVSESDNLIILNEVIHHRGPLIKPNYADSVCPPIGRLIRKDVKSGLTRNR